MTVRRASGENPQPRDTTRAVEYRLRWQREGHEPVLRIYQTKRAAIAEAQRVMAIDRLDLDGTQFSIPPLVQPPILYVRECAPWHPADEQPFIEGMDRWLDASADVQEADLGPRPPRDPTRPSA